MQKLFINQFSVDAATAAQTTHSKIHSFIEEMYAQNAEDIIVAGLLRARLRQQGRGMESISYVEIGANNPIYTSNSYLLYRKYGASGVLCEADPLLIDDLKKARERDRIVNVAVSDTHDAEVTFHVGNASELSSLIKEHVDSFGNFNGLGGVERRITVKNMHINDFLGSLNLPYIDFLSIDCEGMDLKIIEAMDLQTFRPYLIQCEPSEHFASGNGDAMVESLSSRGYTLIAETGVNLIFADGRGSAPDAQDAGAPRTKSKRTRTKPSEEPSIARS